MDFARSWAGQRSMHLVDMFSFSKAMSRLGLAGSESGIGWKSGECERPGGQMLSAFLNTHVAALECHQLINLPTCFIIFHCHSF